MRLNRIYVRSMGMQAITYMCDQWACRRSHTCAINGHAGAHECGLLFGQIAGLCDHRHGLFGVSSYDDSRTSSLKILQSTGGASPQLMVEGQKGTHQQSIKQSSNQATNSRKDPTSVGGYFRTVHSYSSAWIHSLNQVHCVACELGFGSREGTKKYSRQQVRKTGRITIEPVLN